MASGNGTRSLAWPLRTAEAAVIIGGLALGAGGTRAGTIGADAYGAIAAVAIKARPLEHSAIRPRRRDAVEPEQAHLESPRPEVVEDCVREPLQLQPALRSMTDAHLTTTSVPSDSAGLTVPVCMLVLQAKFFGCAGRQRHRSLEPG